MPRRPRLFAPDVAHHIISRGNNRQPLFKRREDFRYFLFILRELKREYVFDVYHYCLMTNHIHLLMRFDQPVGFMKVPQRMNLLYAKYFARTYKYVGHVFQDRFKSWPVAENNYLMECGRYIERNPLKAKIVSKPEDYEWSSYRYYAEGKVDRVISPDPLYLDLAASDQDRRHHYAAYVNGERSHEAAIEVVMFGKTRR